MSKEMINLEIPQGQEVRVRWLGLCSIVLLNGEITAQESIESPHKETAFPRSTSGQRRDILGKSA